MPCGCGDSDTPEPAVSSSTDVPSSASDVPGSAEDFFNKLATDLFWIMVLVLLIGAMSVDGARIR